MLTDLNKGGKTRNVAFQLVLQQRCKTSWTFLLPVLPKLVTNKALPNVAPRQTDNKSLTRIFFCFKVQSNGKQKRATAFETLFQNELNSDFVRFPLWIRQTYSATNKLKAVAGCEKWLQRVAERLERCSTFCHKICTKSVARFTDPRQTCFEASNVNSVYGVTPE